MEKLKHIGQRLWQYRYAALVLLLGVGLMLVPGGNSRKEAPAAESPQQTQPSLSARLEAVLADVAGVGRVQVLLTLEAGPQTLYIQDDGGTVTVTDSQRNESGLVDRELSETYRGAVVVCQGADSPAVRLAVVEAVANATGLGTDRITVLKMK